MEMLCPECMAPLSSPDGATAVCTTHHGQYQILFARYAPVGLVAKANMTQPNLHQPALMSAPPPIPGTSEAYAAKLAEAFGVPAEPAVVAMCSRHPAVQAATYCQTCRAPVCATCLFVFPGGIQLCPSCAANPSPKMSSKRKGLMIWSICLAVWSLLALAAMLIIAISMRGQSDVEAVSTLFGYVSLIPALIGVALGVATFDRRLATPGIVWFGVIGNGVVLLAWLLLIVIGIMMK